MSSIGHQPKRHIHESYEPTLKRLSGFSIAAEVHGHPRTHTTWCDVAASLAAAGYSVVCPDLRGYGESTVPADRPDHSQASKRAMAACEDYRAGLGVDRRADDADRAARIGIGRVTGNRPPRARVIGLGDGVCGFWRFPRRAGGG
jgi:hypothetical protein